MGTPVGIQVADFEELRLGGPRQGTRASAEMWLTTEGQLITFRLGGAGSLVRSGDLEALEARVLSASDRSDELARRLLVEGHALYPPDEPAKARRRADSFLRAIEPLIGKARITEIDFPPVPNSPQVNERPWEDSAGKPSVVVSLKWFVRATTANASLFFVIDPLQGNVLSVQLH